MHMKIVYRKPSTKIYLSDIFLTLIVFVSMRLDSISYLIPQSNFVTRQATNLLTYFVLGEIAFLIFFFMKNSFSPVMCLILSFLGWYICTSVINGSAFFTALTECAAPLSLALISEYEMKRNPNRYLNVLQNLFVILLLIDIITIILYPDGLYQSSLYTENWFLGYKTARVRAVGLPAIMVAGINSLKERGKLTVKFSLITALVLCDTYLSGATAGLFALIFLALAIILLFWFKKDILREKVKIILNPWILLIILLIINLMFAVFQSFDIFEGFITNILGKDMTLTGRVSIWASSIMIFLSSPVIGKGYISSKQYMALSGWVGGTQPHNLILSILVYTGIVGAIIYATMTVYTIKRIEQKTPTMSSICILMFMANIVLGITSITMFSQFSYACLVIAYYLAGEKRNGSNEVYY